MSLMEQKRETKKRRSNLETRFSQRFEKLYIHDNLCFRKPDGIIFSVCSFPDEGAMVIEYAENFQDAILNRFEDGDRFYLEEMDEETMFRNMLREIEQ